MSDEPKRTGGKTEGPIQYVKRRFLIPGSECFNTERLRSLPLPEVLQEPCGAFVANLDGASSACCLPVTLAIASTQERRLQQLQIAEHIRSGAEPHCEVAAEAARVEALRRLEVESASREGQARLASSACEFLMHRDVSCCVNSVGGAAEELLRQGVVLVWGAFEVLCRDVFVAVLNRKPDLSKVLLQSPEGKRVFDRKVIDMETLARFSFDVSTKMGSVLSESQDLSNLVTVKSIFFNLFPKADGLVPALNDNALWVLNQRRHLIVHRRGIVDHRYVERTGEVIPEGRRLGVSPDDLMTHIEAAKSGGIEILSAAAASLQATT